MFDADKRTLLAGEPVTVAFSYRNAAQASVTARSVDMKRWQEERMDKVQTSSTLGNAYRKKYSSLGTLLFNLLHEPSYARYLGEEIKGEKVALAPGERHLNRIAQIPVPTRKPGWYLLTVTLDNGYRVPPLPHSVRHGIGAPVPCRKAISGSWADAGNGNARGRGQPAPPSLPGG